MDDNEKYGLANLKKEYDPPTFGETFESYRLGEEIIQVEMKKKIGISPQSLCDIENGRRIPSPDRAAKIARAVGEPGMFWVKLALRDNSEKEI